MTKLEQILKLLPYLDIDELEQLHERSRPKYESVEVTCPRCGKHAAMYGRVYPEGAKGTLPLCISPEGRHLFYDWYQSDVDVDVAVDVYCSSCGEYTGSRPDIQEIWDRERNTDGSKKNCKINH